MTTYDAAFGTPRKNHKFKLNIGRLVSANPDIRLQEFDVFEAWRKLGYLGMLIKSIRKGTSKSGEPTFIIESVTAHHPWEIDTEIEKLSIALGQDCIAMIIDGYPGRLVGPHAAKWQPFNAEFWLD